LYSQGDDVVRDASGNLYGTALGGNTCGNQIGCGIVWEFSAQQRRHRRLGAADPDPSGPGTHLRMEQSGFRADQNQAYQGAKAGWPRFIASLEQVLGRVD
jgi:hypothetical protein